MFGVILLVNVLIPVCTKSIIKTLLLSYLWFCTTHFRTHSYGTDVCGCDDDCIAMIVMIMIMTTALVMVTIPLFSLKYSLLLQTSINCGTHVNYYTWRWSVHVGNVTRCPELVSCFLMPKNYKSWVHVSKTGMFTLADFFKTMSSLYWFRKWKPIFGLKKLILPKNMNGIICGCH
jgi:hypothetical protein